MFKKILSNLPFNPSLITQLTFYAKRLQKESSIRKTGFVFMSLTLVVQGFAVIAPAEASNQCSSNDVVRCGFRSREEAVRQCNDNSQGFRTILEYYGVSCAKLAGAQTRTINSRANNNQLYSMGRNPYNKTGEYPVDIPGAGKFYLRPLSSWGNTNHKMLVSSTSDGQTLNIMYSCGNIVINRGYTPPVKEEPPSKLTVAKKVEPNTTVKPGDILKYTVAFTNKGGTSGFFSVNDQLSNNLEYVDSKYSNWVIERNGQRTKWYNNTPPFYTFGNTDAFGSPGFITLRAKVKANVKDGDKVCNTVWLEDLNKATKKAQKWKEVKVCNTVRVVQTPQPEPEPEPEIGEPVVAIKKEAANLTQNIEDANGTTANPGDVIEYRLHTTNFGDAEAKNYPLESEDLADVLEYANLDLNSLGDGILDTDSQTIAWNKPVNIKGGETITKTFRVTIKDPLPQTPTPEGNPGSYDMVLTNVYGNTIEIKVPPSVVKTTEQVTQTLPNTGPGEAIAGGITLVVISGYFFARSRLMAKELVLVKEEYSSGGY